MKRGLTHRTDLDRARGALLGLALGDAFGRTLEFVFDEERVRAAPVGTGAGELRWTDETHMAVHLARALARAPAGPLDPEGFARSAAEALVRWRDEAYALPWSTSPGETCLDAIERYAADGDCQHCGHPESEGSAPLARVAPLALAFRGAALDEAARRQTALTHGHRNALDAAAAAARLARAAIECGALAPELVRSVARKGSGDVARSLALAIEVAERPNLEWLPDSEFPSPGRKPGGGWRAPSALGLAVAAALRWEGDFAVAVEKAARIAGDSDTVAALAGMLVGAARGASALPAPWLDAIPWREEIEALAVALAQRPVVEKVVKGTRGRSVLVPSRPRAEANPPIEVDWLPIDLPPAGGTIGLAALPKKQRALSTERDRWDRRAADDLERLRTVFGADLLICLAGEGELAACGVPELATEAERLGMILWHLPVAPEKAPEIGATRHAVELARAFARAGRHAVALSRGGCGRAGTFGACCFVAAGLGPDAAIAAVRKTRHGAIETKAQVALVRAFAGARATRAARGS